MVVSATPSTSPHLKDGWRTVRFGDVVRNVDVSEKNPLAIELDRVVGLEHIEPGSLHIREWGDVADGTSFSRTFRAGQVLFGKRRAYQRKVAYAEFDGVCSGDILVFEAIGDQLSPDLLPFIVQSEPFFEHALQTSAGSLSPRTKWTELAKYEFVLPPKDEQRRIAAILWASDAAVEQYLLLEHEFARLLQVHSTTSLFDPSIGRTTLKSVASVKNGATPSRNEPTYWTDGKIPWLPSGKIHDRYIVAADETITSRGAKSASLELIPSGSVLVAMIGQGRTRGTAAYLATEACINQNLAAVTPGEKVDSWYLFYYLSASYERLRQASQGSNQGALNCGIVEQFPFPSVSLERQRELGCRLRAIDSATDGVRQHIISLRAMSVELRAKLLTATHT